jgi:hypothetical protein
LPSAFFWRPSASRRLAFGFDCRRRLRHSGIGVLDLFGSPLLVGAPIRQLLAALYRGRAEPPRNLGLRLRNAIGHRLVLRQHGFDPSGIERRMPALNRPAMAGVNSGWGRSLP